MRFILKKILLLSITRLFCLFLVLGMRLFGVDMGTQTEDRHLKTKEEYAENIFLQAQAHFLKQEYVMAVPLFEEAVKHHHVEAMINLGQCFDNGWGCKQDVNHAFYLYSLAAQKDHPIALRNVGNMLVNGVGDVPKNVEKAIESWEKAALKGDPVSQFNLAIHYKEGILVRKDVEKAARLYEQSARQGFVRAQFSLAYCYKMGFGVTQNILTAMYWYEKAAEQGHVKAIINVAVFHEINGRFNEAAYWYKMAADCGWQMAHDRLRFINSTQHRAPQ